VPQIAGRPSVTPDIRSSNLRIKRDFSDHEEDQFLEDSFEYMVRYFEGSLAELSKRNPHIQTRFRRIDGNSFTVAAYASGRRAAQCTIWMGGRQAFGGGIVFSYEENAPRGSFNEKLDVVNDGYDLFLKPLGLTMAFAPRTDAPFSQQGAAEYYWSLFIERLQS
jgi:hypothetical protein